MKSRRTAGFTLIEMMVVIVIIGILAAVLVVVISGRADKARVEGTKAILEQIGNAIEEFKLNHKRYPDKLEDLRQRPSYVNEGDWPPGGYLKKDPKDGWGNEILYRRPGKNSAPFELISLGEDARDGGEGFAKDLTYPE